ncbi:MULTISPECIES: hypothetical protein [unclassified Mesorhizobium]|uniref:ATP-dependent DNA ligase n=1 Tax=unclassified Mesorhizobium TaxID=325217 RepID=UPI000FCA328F|nr:MULTISPECIES: hypothetical protein [unclassified Mesorhizobium]TGP26310.1 hypothetical protein EN874_001105 [Mesorhizobium sp. M1D.F.Ca.ET.231.01.1.1]TGP38268.1 hypothetical protein EN877_01105 [Mesorhizobium sp. M1D.F.Ca.ET.234.01.1.1]TGS50479.1 hypothetical protein EN827_01105 [Mesorhizobium sp. M1D.F.Ca.ET.184.01.1.1]TGS66365.1 hypothetical protein EN826_001105 [Mesorhizobium sp. M1D.F.Ca.ET.183.01.1.1]
MRNVGERLTFIKPMEPELVEQPPIGGEWTHEVKFDGYRTQLIKDADGIRLYTKTGIDWTAKYRPLAEEAASLDAESFIIEAETIVTNEAGLKVQCHAGKASWKWQSATSAREPSASLASVP